MVELEIRNEAFFATAQARLVLLEMTFDQGAVLIEGEFHLKTIHTLVNRERGP